MNALKRLEEWYQSNCDGDWEHSSRLRLTSLDNPGWGLDVFLQDSEFEGVSFKEVQIERAEHDWLHCFVENNTFKVRCGPMNLEEAVVLFLNWYDQASVNPGNCREG
jgi:hypothetical protein